MQVRPSRLLKKIRDGGADVVGLGDYFRSKVAEFGKLPFTQTESVYR